MRKGTKHTDETKAKIASAKEGKTFTSEHCAAIATSLKDKKKTSAHKHAISVGIKLARANKAVVVDPVLPGTDTTIITEA